LSLSLFGNSALEHHAHSGAGGLVLLWNWKGREGQRDDGSTCALLLLLFELLTLRVSDSMNYWGRGKTPPHSPRAALCSGLEPNKLTERLKGDCNKVWSCWGCECWW